jgi:hypothetical protein
VEIKDLQGVLDMHTDLLKQEMNQMTKRHVQVNALLIAVLSFLLIIASFVGVQAVRSLDRKLAAADAQLAAANKKMDQYEQDRVKAQDTLKLLDSQIEVLTRSQEHLLQNVVTRNRTVDQTIKDTMSTTDSDQIAANFRKAYNRDISYGPYGMFELQADVVKEVTATEIDRDRLVEDLQDTQGLYLEEKNKFAVSEQKVATLTASENECHTALQQMQGAAKAEQKAAHKGKFKRFVSAASKPVLFVAGIALGVYLAR